MIARIPTSPDQPGGPFITAEDDQFDVLASRERVVIIEFSSLPEGVNWFDTYELLYCERSDSEGSVTVIRKATEDERRAYRIPIFIQDDAVPVCCGKPMFFVGQLDNDRICMERPAEAKVWWHDAASFYVFTCSQCLQCKAIGQQM